MTWQQIVAPFVIPYTRLELPGWGALMRAAGAFREPAWKHARRRVVRGKLHGYVMPVELANWSERFTYFVGRFYDLPTQLLIRNCLKEGDVFVDIGANIGMMSLVAARRVGPRGRVLAFEPNPVAAARLEAVLRMNSIEHCVLHRVALSDSSGQAVLTVPRTHTGGGTLGPLKEWDGEGFVTHTVPTRRGDEYDLDEQNPVMIKIDVEGFECHVIRGLERTLSRCKPLVATEIAPEWLQRAGQSLEALFDLMIGHGYRGYALGLRRRGLRHDLRLRSVRGPADCSGEQNAAWLLRGSDQAERLRRWIVEG